jgi:hypothetical protein
VSKIAKQLQQTHAELEAVTQELATLDAEKAGALKSSSDYAKWSRANEAAELERDRLVLLAEKLAADLEREKADTTRSVLASRKAELQKQSTELARRIADEGRRAAAILIQLANEAKDNAVAVDLLNSELPDDEMLLHADHLARHRDPAPRQDIEETVVDLWTFEQSGEIVGDPDSVVERSYEFGFIPGTEVSRRNIPVIRRRFRQIRYLAQGDREWAAPLASLLRLPRFDAPGMLFDRGQAVEPAPRRELIELIPAPDAPAKPATNEAA